MLPSDFSLFPQRSTRGSWKDLISYSHGECLTSSTESLHKFNINPQSRIYWTLIAAGMNFYICANIKIPPIHQPVVTPIAGVWWPIFTPWIWVRNVCTSTVTWLLPCSSSSSFWTCHTLSPISSSRLWKNNKTKQQ